MSEISDLEAYATEPTPIDNERAAHARRNRRKLLVHAYAGSRKTTSREHFYAAGGRRQVPSLPKLKCLERDHEQG